MIAADDVAYKVKGAAHIFSGFMNMNDQCVCV